MATKIIGGEADISNTQFLRIFTFLMSGMQLCKCTWVKSRWERGQTIVSQHVQKGGFPGIIQAEEQNFAIFIAQSYTNQINMMFRK